MTGLKPVCRPLVRKSLRPLTNGLYVWIWFCRTHEDSHAYQTHGEAIDGAVEHVTDAAKDHLAFQGSERYV